MTEPEEDLGTDLDADLDTEWVVVDTDLVIDFLRGKGAGSALIPRLLAEGRFALSAVTAFELRVGADFVARGDTIAPLLRRPPVAFDVASALLAGRVAAELSAAGAPIGMADCMQAGICLRYELPLATRNRKHFERVVGLRLLELP